jgi:peptidoglycan/LPS O-acetylase OafA/YrhL
MTVEPKKFAFIDALRGLAILAVILVHAGSAVPPSSAWLATLMASGARGVQLFYIASALTLCLSWQARSAAERAPLRNFYLRRLFRIVPMFYIAIAGYLLLYGLAPRYYAPNGVEWYYVPLTALFLNGFHPETITSVVPGGWSIVVEMTFYLVLPLLIQAARSITALVVLGAITLIGARAAASLAYAVYRSAYPADQLYLVDALAELNFFSQLPVFVFGMIAWWLQQHRAAWTRGVTAGALLFAGWLAAMTVTGMPVTRVLAMPVAMGAVFAIGALLLERWPVALLVNPLTTTIGKLSFSMYLSHFAVLDGFAAAGISRWFTGGGNAAALAHYLLLVIATAAVSRITYVFIERPAIAAGRGVIERLETGRPLGTEAGSAA